MRERTTFGELDGGHSAHIITVEKALQTMKTRAEASMGKEFGSIIDKDVFDPVVWESLTRKQQESTITSFMFLKEKILPEPKLKSRFVGGGHKQDRSVYDPEETSSPTASNAAVYSVAAIAAHEGRKVRTMDVGSAYLNASLEREVYMSIKANLAKIICGIKPEWARFLRRDGSMVVRLKKALYGLIEASKLWFKDITDFLKGLGFVANPKDECIFNTIRDGHQVTVALYVDDLLATSINPEDLEWLRLKLVEKYKEVSDNDGDVHHYLGQKFDFSIKGECYVTMEEYFSAALDDYGVAGTRATPAADDLFTVDEDSKCLDTTKAAQFHSRVAKMLWPAVRCRPDVLVAVSFLAGRV